MQPRGKTGAGKAYDHSANLGSYKQNKGSAGRQQDQHDIEALGSALKSVSSVAAAGFEAASKAVRATAAGAKSFAQSVAAGATSAGQKLQEWGGAITGVGAKFAAAGAVIKGFLGAALKTFEEMGTAAKKMADDTGLSVEALSTLGFAVRQTGASMGSLSGAMSSLRNTLGGIGDGSKAGQAALAQLGLTLADLAGKNADDQFRTIAERLSRVQDPAQRAAGALAIFGSSASGLMPLLAKGSHGLQSLEDRARALGLEMSGKDAGAAESLHNALAELWDTVKMVTFSIGAPLADATREFVEMATTVVARVGRWVRENAELIVTANKIGNVLAGVGTALAVLGGAISAAGVALVEITAAVASLLSPIALVIAAVGGLGYYLVTYTQQGQAALAALTATFFQLRDDAVAAFGGITDALLAGDLELALQVAMAGIMLEWTKGINFLNEKWQTFKYAAIDVAAELATGIAGAFIDAFAEIRRLWTKTLGMLTEQAEAFQSVLTFDIPGVKQLHKAYADSMGGTSAADMKAAAGAKIGAAKDALTGNKAKDLTDAAAASADDAQKAFDDAVAKAHAARQNMPERKPDAAPIAASFTTATAAASESAKPTRTTPGIGFEDARSAGGFKAVASLLRQGRDDPQARSAKTLEELLGVNVVAARYQKDVRDKLMDIQMVGF